MKANVDNRYSSEPRSGELPHDSEQPPVEELSHDAAEDISHFLDKNVVQKITGGTKTMQDISEVIDAAKGDVSKIKKTIGDIDDFEIDMEGSLWDNTKSINETVSDIKSAVGDVDEGDSLWKKTASINDTVSDIKSAVGDVDNKNSLLGKTKSIDNTVSDIKSAVGDVDEGDSLWKKTTSINDTVSDIKSAVGDIATKDTLLGETKIIKDSVYDIKSAVRDTATKDTLLGETKILIGTLSEIKTAVDNIKTDAETNVPKKIDNVSTAICNKIDAIIEEDKLDIKSVTEGYPLLQKLVIALLSVGTLNFLGIVALIILQIMG